MTLKELVAKYGVGSRAVLRIIGWDEYPFTILADHGNYCTVRLSNDPHDSIIEYVDTIDDYEIVTEYYGMSDEE